MPQELPIDYWIITYGLSYDSSNIAWLYDHIKKEYIESIDYINQHIKEKALEMKLITM